MQSWNCRFGMILIELKIKTETTNLVFVQIVFLIKFGWGLYYTIQGICDKVQEKQGEKIKDSHPGY